MITGPSQHLETESRQGWLSCGRGRRAGGRRRRGETGFFSRKLGGPVYVSKKQEVTSGLSLSLQLTLGSESHG